MLGRCGVHSRYVRGFFFSFLFSPFVYMLLNKWWPTWMCFFFFIRFLIVSLSRATRSTSIKTDQIPPLNKLMAFFFLSFSLWPGLFFSSHLKYTQCDVHVSLYSHQHLTGSFLSSYTTLSLLNLCEWVSLSLSLSVHLCFSFVFHVTCRSAAISLDKTTGRKASASNWRKEDKKNRERRAWLSHQTIEEALKWQ